MTSNDALQEVCDAVEIDFSEGVAYLDYAFGRSVELGETRAFCLSETKDGMGRGKRKFAKFVKLCVERGVLSQADFVFPGKYTSPYSSLSIKGSSQELGVEDHCYPRMGGPGGNLDFLKLAGILSGEELPEPTPTFATVEEEREVRKARAAASVEWEAKASEAYQRLWHPELVQQIVGIALAEKPSEAISWQVILHSFYEPVLRLQERFHIERDIIGRALEETIRRNIGNVMYAVAIAKSEQKRADDKRADYATIGQGKRNVFYTEDGQSCGQMDVWALKDPKYREQYIRCFGLPEGYE